MVAGVASRQQHQHPSQQSASEQQQFPKWRFAHDVNIEKSKWTYVVSRYHRDRSAEISWRAYLVQSAAGRNLFWNGSRHSALVWGYIKISVCIIYKKKNIKKNIPNRVLYDSVSRSCTTHDWRRGSSVFLSAVGSPIGWLQPPGP